MMYKYILIVLICFSCSTSLASECFEKLSDEQRELINRTVKEVTYANVPEFPVGEKTAEFINENDSACVVLEFDTTACGYAQNPQVVYEYPEKIFSRSAIKSLLKYRFDRSNKNRKGMINIEYILSE